MKRKLPEIKKSLKSFILEEDAKIIDRAVLKVSILASLGLSAFTIEAEDVFAGGKPSHSNVVEHTNNVYHEGVDEDLGNNKNVSVKKVFTDKGESLEVDVEAKEIATAHANHYNHTNGAGGGKK